MVGNLLKLKEICQSWKGNITLIPQKSYIFSRLVNLSYSVMFKCLILIFFCLFLGRMCHGVPFLEHITV